jgi:fluoride exporter
MKWLALLFFGILGVFLRYIISVYLQTKLASSFPVSTLIINAVGCFVIGVVYVCGVEKVAMSEEFRLGLMVGLLGGFTTFSSYSLEVVNLLQASFWMQAGAYVLFSQALCIGATGVAMVLTRFAFSFF